jgi:hypothetical protein
MNETVLMIGCAAVKDLDCQNEIQFAIENYPLDVWTINNCFMDIKTDRHFQLHGYESMVNAHGDGYMEELASCGCPVVLFREQANSWYHFNDPALLKPEVIVYPTEQAIELAGREYFDNSFAWMIAMAVLEGRKRIVLAGLNFIGETESWVIPCLSYHLGIARGRGVEIVLLGDKHGLFHDRWGGLYGIAPEAGGL